MPSEIDLLRSLDDEPPNPSTVDLPRAIAAGRRRRVVRGVGYTSVAAVTALAVAGAAVAGGLLGRGTPQTGTTNKAAASATASAKPKGAYTIPGTPGWKAPAASPPTSCTLEQLPAAGGAPMAIVSGVDPTGQYFVGRSYPASGGYQATIWHNGQPAKVNLPGDLEESLRDVNSAGTAVGWSYTGTTEADTGPVPYAYQNGKVIKLQGVARGEASAINEAGAIVGSDPDGKTALVWPSATAKQPIRLPLPDGASTADARDIDEDGTVAGTIDGNTPYVWLADGTHRALPMPTIDGKPATSARVFHIHNGWATGLAGTSDPKLGTKDKARAKAAGLMGAQQPVRWNLRTGQVSVVSELATDAAGAVNAQGWQIGTDPTQHAVLVTDGATIQLPALADHQPNGVSNIANGLSDDGRTIAGQSDDAGGTIKPVVWHCK